MSIKISQLLTLTTPDPAADVVPVVDTSANATRKISVGSIAGQAVAFLDNAGAGTIAAASYNRISVVLLTAGGPLTFTLPPLATVSNILVLYTNISAETITMQPDGADTLTGGNIVLAPGAACLLIGLGVVATWWRAEP